MDRGEAFPYSGIVDFTLTRLGTEEAVALHEKGGKIRRRASSHQRQ